MQKITQSEYGTSTVNYWLLQHDTSTEITLNDQRVLPPEIIKEGLYV